MVEYERFLEELDREAYHEGEVEWEEDGLTVTRTYNYSAPGCHDSCGILLYTDAEGKLIKTGGHKQRPAPQIPNEARASIPWRCQQVRADHLG